MKNSRSISRRTSLTYKKVLLTCASTTTRLAACDACVGHFPNQALDSHKGCQRATKSKARVNPMPTNRYINIGNEKCCMFVNMSVFLSKQLEIYPALHRDLGTDQWNNWMCSFQEWVQEGPLLASRGISKERKRRRF